MAVTLLVAEASQESIVSRVSPLAELCACLHALAEPEHHPTSHQWTAGIRDSLDDELLIRAGVWAPLWGAFRARYLLPLDAEASIGGELAAIERLPEDVFLAMSAQALIGKTMREPPAPDRLLARLSLISELRRELGARLLDDVGKFRRDLLTFLAEMADAAFDPEWTRLRAMLARHARAKTDELHRNGFRALASLPTASAKDDPPRIVFDKFYHATADLAESSCLLVPSLHLNPHIVIKHYPGFPVVVQYPVQAAGGAPSLNTVHLRLAVLSEMVRMNICQILLRETMTTTELAVRFGMSTPQMSRHLRHLRQAGLVLAHRSGTRVHYQLDEDAVRRLGPDLLSALYR